MTQTTPAHLGPADLEKRRRVYPRAGREPALHGGSKKNKGPAINRASVYYAKTLRSDYSKAYFTFASAFSIGL
jgi:hypothetical protein